MISKDTENIVPADADAKQVSHAPALSGARMLASSTASDPMKTDESGSAYEEYLYGRNMFVGGKRLPAWSDSTHGRLFIRIFSRGVLGAAAFAWGGRYSQKHMQNYEPEAWKAGDHILPTIAKGIDSTFGVAFQKIAHVIAPASQKAAWEQDVVRFRSKAYFHDASGLKPGRSLGSEIVGVTFDFSVMSIGDGVGRNVVQAFDPNVKKPWIDDDGHFHFDKWVNSLVRSSWRIVTKNAGEDWGAALPYVYYMKWQRQAITKLKFNGKTPFQDSKWGFDNSLNGGPLKVNSAGNIVGDNQLAGLIDLHGRFATYNWFTLMYRETYDAIGNTIKKVTHHEPLNIKLPDNPLMAPVDLVGSTLRYVAKSFIKANLYMQPAVIPFWLFRTPQTKWRASYILEDAMKEQNQVLTLHPTMPGKSLANGTTQFNENLSNSRIRISGKHQIHGGNTAYAGTQAIPNPYHKYGDPYSWESVKHQSGAAQVLNPLGWICDRSGRAFTHLGEFVGNRSKPIQNFLGQTPAQREVFLRSYVDAAWAYTPYFFAKDEFALRVDDKKADGSLGKMDRAIYRLIDNVFTFNAPGVGAALGNMWQLFLHAPANVKKREGDDPDAKAKSGIAEAVPTTRVHTKTVQYGPRHAPQERAGDMEDTRSSRHWAEEVTSRKLEADQQPGRPTLH